jgi:hypothetical protein
MDRKTCQEIFLTCVFFFEFEDGADGIRWSWDAEAAAVLEQVSDRGTRLVPWPTSFRQQDDATAAAGLAGHALTGRASSFSGHGAHHVESQAQRLFLKTGRSGS